MTTVSMPSRSAAMASLCGAEVTTDPRSGSFARVCWSVAEATTGPASPGRSATWARRLSLRAGSTRRRGCFSTGSGSSSKLGIPFGSYWGHVLLGYVHRARRRWADAVEAYQHGLALQRQSGFTTHAADIYSGLALVAIGVDQTDCAARLLDTAERCSQLYGEEPSIDPGPDYVRNLAEARARLISHGVADGRRLTPEQAIAEAEQAAQTLMGVCTRRPAGLTAREAEIIRLLAEGLSNAEIAGQLVVSPRTVHAHVRSIFHKLAVTSRSAAVHEAARLGLS